MVSNHNWDVCPCWVKFSPKSRYKHLNVPSDYIRQTKHNWDVCPHWAKFSSNRTKQGQSNKIKL
jgi:hypothetical protein